ncbi:hypothetical protein [Streptomyces sp. NPDC058297]|uniref:hypothetical protein n=1 Tax=Streptomyces sp. NPDC058297 TaxID=3346433 RepID=UPI0036E4AD32
MPQMSKVELYAAIRRDHRAGMKMRELERKHNVSWRTVKKAVDSVWPEPRKKPPPRRTALDPYKPVIDEMLRVDLDAPRKQRHTITRIFHRLIEEHGADVSYQMVRRYVADRKPEILAASGKAPVEAFVPQTHSPAMEAEVDFGDVTVRLAGELVTCYLFSLRLSYSGKAVHRVFASCGQEAFFEGHVHALRTLGGVPRSKIRYDNLKSAVAQVLGLNRARVETDRWIAFRSHYPLTELLAEFPQVSDPLRETSLEWPWNHQETCRSCPFPWSASWSPGMIRGSPTGSSTRSGYLWKGLLPSYGICRRRDGQRRRFVPTGWIYCDGSASSGLSRCRGTGPAASRQGTSPAGCRSQGSRRALTGGAPTWSAGGLRAESRTPRRSVHTVRRSCEPSTTSTVMPAPARFSTRSRWTAHDGDDERTPTGTRWKRTATNASGSTGRGCRNGFLAASPTRSSTRSSRGCPPTGTGPWWPSTSPPGPAPANF